MISAGIARAGADRTGFVACRVLIGMLLFAAWAGGAIADQVFQKLNEAGVLKSSGALCRFGEWLVFLGIGMLASASVITSRSWPACARSGMR